MALRRWPLLACALGRALDGVSAKLAVGVAALTTLGGLAFGIGTGRSGGAVERVAPLVAGVLVWGAGVLLCFAGSMRAFERDHEDGWDALLARHGVRAGGYLAARVAGLTVATGVITVAGTLVVGVGAALATRSLSMLGLATRGLGAGLAYAAAFSLVVGPVAMATLAPRGRAGGYLALVAVLVVPALLAPWSGELVPDEWRGLVSVPGALDGVRDALLSPDPAGLVRALAVVLAVAAAALLWARTELVLRLLAAHSKEQA